MERENNVEETDDSRRSFMKKGALASSAVALGLASSGSVTGDTSLQQDGVQQASTGLVFVNDYKPEVGFQVVSRIQQPTVGQILGYVDPASPDDAQGAVVDPDDWNGYIVNYQGCGPGNYNLIFLREGVLQQGQTYHFTTDAVFFSNTLQLLEAPIRQGSGDAGAGGGGGAGGDGGNGGGDGGGGANATNPS